MNLREGDRLAIMTGVKQLELTLVQVTELMGLSHRQIKRMWRRRRKPPALQGARSGALCRGMLRGLRPDASGRRTDQGKGRGGS